tara:strand:- start:1949 stop:3532 length:1584 start_codon:yes stop_codon:yes gene_type:complete
MANKSLKDVIKLEFSRCAKDPVHFMRKYCYIQHPHKGKIKFNLYPFQETALTSLRDNDYNVILKSRQLGISTLSAGYSLWLMLFHNDKNILVIATKQEVAKNLVTKVRVMHDGLPGWLKGNCVEDNKLSLRFSNGSQVKAISSSGDAGRSEALSLLIIDEAAFVDQIDDIWASSQQTLATGGGAIILSTPNGTGNFFHKTWVGAEAGTNGFNPIKLHWTMHPDREQDWRDKQDQLLGEKMAAQECDCDFITSGYTVVDGTTLQWYLEQQVQDPIEKRGFDNNYWIWEYPDYGKDYMISADVARGDSTDYSTFHVIDVETLTQVAEYKGQLPTKDFGNMLVNAATEWNNALLVIENANVGWAAIQPAIDRDYPNLFYSTADLTTIDTGIQLKKRYDLKSKEKMVPGFTTTSKTRPLIISKLDTYFREKACTVRSKRLIDELFVFVWKGSKAQAQGGYNDDLVMAFSIGMWVRDTALMLRQKGMDLTRSTLDNIKVNRGPGVYTNNAPQNNPWVQKGPSGDQDLTWLIK